MSKFSPETYSRMFNALLSQELMCSSSVASEHNIMSGIKRVLGQAIKNNVIKGYEQLDINNNLDVNFVLHDVDGDVFPITLFYGE
jgi:hypothetical protein